MVTVPHYSQPDDNSRMTLYVPLVSAASTRERNK